MTPHPTEPIIGARIRTRRKALALSQEKLGAELTPPLTQPAVAKWERRQRLDADLTRVHDFARALKTTPEYLLGLTDDETAA